MKKLFLIILINLIFLFPVMVFATGLGDASNNLSSVTKDTGLSGDFTTTLGAVIKGALSLVGTIFLILMVYAGILWMTAQGKEESVEKASKIIKASIIGLFITMSAYAITYFASNKLGASSSETAPSSKSYCCCSSNDGLGLCETSYTDSAACSKDKKNWVEMKKCNKNY